MNPDSTQEKTQSRTRFFSGLNLNLNPYLTPEET